MKAAIFYDQIDSALRTSKLLQGIGPNKDFKIAWEIDLCHTGILRFRSVADEALKQSADADMIAFSGCSANSLRPWTIQWLDRWVSTRINEHAVLALVDDEFSDIHPQMDAFVLSEFARHHNIAFVACSNDVEQINQIKRNCADDRLTQHENSTALGVLDTDAVTAAFAHSLWGDYDSGCA